MRDALDLAAAFGLTTLAHGTVLALLALLVERLLRPDDAAREALWRVVLVGSLLTASVQLGFGIEPWAGRWTHTAALDASPSAPAAPSEVAAPSLTEPAPTAFEFTARDALHAATAAWLLAAAVALALLALAYVRLRRSLAGRADAVGLADLAEPIALELGLLDTPRISVAADAPTPLALGILRPEICVPRAALTELDEPELRAMLAHELAHVRRRDPACTLLYAIVCRVLFWQPALWFARRRLLQLAELRCDAIARGTHAHAGLALARALVRAAEWLSARAHLPRIVHGSAMAASTSGLELRVRRLLDAPAPARRLRSATTRAFAGALLLGAPLALPGAGAPAASEPVLAAMFVDDLPPGLASLVRDLATLRRDVAELRDATASAGLLDDAAIAELFAEVDRRLTRLDARCADVVARARATPSPTFPSVTSR
jgi:beta-lactamase regulating signal transducer with metallopeptidase domain